MRSLGFWFVGTVAPAAMSTRFVRETAVPLCSVVGFVRNLCAVVGSVWSRGPRCKVWKHYVFWIMFAHFAQLFFGYTFAPITQRVACYDFTSRAAETPIFQKNTCNSSMVHIYRTIQNAGVETSEHPREDQIHSRVWRMGCTPVTALTRQAACSAFFAHNPRLSSEKCVLVVWTRGPAFSFSLEKRQLVQ